MVGLVLLSIGLYSTRIWPIRTHCLYFFGTISRLCAIPHTNEERAFVHQNLVWKVTSWSQIFGIIIRLRWQLWFLVSVNWFIFNFYLMFQHICLVFSCFDTILQREFTTPQATLLLCDLESWWDTVHDAYYLWWVLFDW